MVVHGTLVVLPMTVRDKLLPALVEKLTVLEKAPVKVGLKRTVTVWLSPGPRLYDAPLTMLKGADVVTEPPSVPPPVFCTSNM